LGRVRAWRSPHSIEFIILARRVGNKEIGFDVCRQPGNALINKEFSMTIKIFVLQEQSDQSAFYNEEKPEKHVQREFATEKEMALYRTALNAAAGLCDHTITNIGESDVTINRWWSKVGGSGKNKTFKFSNDGEKQAILDGLTDGDGCVEPQVIRDDQGTDYGTLAFIIEHGRAPTDDELDELYSAPAGPGM
jgi:hypothetical protein